ncbi:hypothetical protein [Sphingomonas sp. 28-63-12]|uniref:hypothetical protein n=1 Tax=Sphingomonas sp. 28-63-12 TaxID=1970434 RepID=UPI000BC8283D|nr:MAG: hypothetical protein B7Y47_16420 [Sphingomonas sp. 28-63-12]
MHGRRLWRPVANGASEEQGAAGSTPVGGHYSVASATGTFLAKRLRPTSAAAAAPNSKTIGGAGTGVGGPPLLVMPVLLMPLLVMPVLVMPLLVLKPVLLVL